MFVGDRTPWDEGNRKLESGLMYISFEESRW